MAVAFYTLLERKVLGYIILRKGPNKPCFSGLLVPFADALKLFIKSMVFPIVSSCFGILCSCLLLFLIPTALWSFIALQSPATNVSFSFLRVLVLISFSVFGLLLAGWASNSKYSVIGSTRCVAQSISFEVCLSLLLLIWANTKSLNLFSRSIFFGFCFFAHLCFILFVVSLAETNRSPFDFAEGESELVSGYNVEFSGIGFTLLFLSEYLSLLFMSFICGFLFSDGTFLVYFCFWGFLSFLFV